MFQIRQRIFLKYSRNFRGLHIHGFVHAKVQNLDRSRRRYRYHFELFSKLILLNYQHLCKMDLGTKSQHNLNGIKPKYDLFKNPVFHRKSLPEFFQFYCNIDYQECKQVGTASPCNQMPDSFLFDNR